MTKLVWDATGERKYEDGVDRGVLYPPDGIGVSWNGLRSVTENRSDDSSVPYYLDAVKYLDGPQPNDFKATVTALTYPDEFLPFDGILDLGTGMLIDSQPVSCFGLSYRTFLGNDLEDLASVYRIHVLYNLFAVPTSKEFSSLSEDSAPVEFSWDVSGIPVTDGSFRPSVHFMFQSNRINATQLVTLEETLYGNDTQEAQLPSIDVLSDILATT